jgi:Protein of unknown function (DUF2569)
VSVATQPQGFRGWLLLLAIGVCLSPLRTLVEFVKAFEDYGRAWTVPNGRTLVLFEVGINLALIALEVATMVAMLNRYRAFIKLFIWLWGAAFVLPVADMVVTALLFPQVPSEAFVAEVGRTILVTIVRGLWVWYLLVSVRVKNTFTT